MARLAEWTITEASGRQHRVLVERLPLLGVGVLVDTRRIDRFDRTPKADRYATNLAGHVLTVNTPRAAKDQPTLHIDGNPVLGTETRLAASLAGASDLPAGAVSSRDLVRFQLLQRRNTGGAWFYWIGAVSILNSVLNAAGTQWGLSVALGVTYVIDGLAAGFSNTIRTPVYAFVIDIAIAGGFMLIGRAARRGNLAWYAIGISLYLLDSVLFIVVRDILGIAVHAIAIYWLLSGWRAARSLKRLETPTPAVVG
jgi:hypothetical protein